MNPFQTIGQGVSAGVNAVFGGSNPIGSFLSPLVNGFSSIAQTGLAAANYKQNYDTAQQNLQLQQDKFEYDKALQQQIFEREDTAYQRTVNDMRSAGLSPLNMSGQNGVGSVVSTSAPQRQTQSATDAINAFNNAFNTFATMQQTLSSVKNAQKQNQLLQTEIDANNIDNVSRRFRNLAEIRNIISQTNLRNKDISSFDVLLEDSLANSASLRSSRESENVLRSSETDLNKSLKQKEDDYNSLQDIRKYILDNQKYMSDYERQEMLSNLKRLLRDNNFMERFGLTDSMSDELKSLGIDLSDSVLFDFGSPTALDSVNSSFNEVRKMRRAGRALNGFVDTAGSAFGEKLLMAFAELLGVK